MFSSAHTCFNQLHLPEYISADLLECLHGELVADALPVHGEHQHGHDGLDKNSAVFSVRSVEIVEQRMHDFP